MCVCVCVIYIYIYTVVFINFAGTNFYIFKKISQAEMFAIFNFHVIYTERALCLYYISQMDSINFSISTKSNQSKN